jgi:intracellular sulfur oxidation DsrE/DsrF family protein
MKGRIVAAACVAAVSMFIQLSSAVAAEPAAVTQPAAKVVFQVSDSDPAKWNLALNNVANARKVLGPTMVAEIVAFGPGIGMLKFDSVVAERIRGARESGIEIVACENTMAAQKLTRDDMLAGIGYVPAGVVELIRRQQEGYAYIRP